MFDIYCLAVFESALLMLYSLFSNGTSDFIVVAGLTSLLMDFASVRLLKKIFFKQIIFLEEF